MIKPYYSENGIDLYLGDCIEVMKQFENNSIDSIVTDPPYELNFMSKDWDRTGIAFQKKLWQEVLRITKPGATLLCFGGTRTYHRLACAIEDAGWIIKDCIMWIYGSGFPKSLNISLAIDKQFGLQGQRGIGGFNTGGIEEQQNRKAKLYIGSKTDGSKLPAYNKPKSNEAKQWSGWGTALKPAYEPILVAMKPNEGTYAQNALKWGVSGLNINGTRIGSNKVLAHHTPKGTFAGGEPRKSDTNYYNNQGRFPANLILECICDEVREGKEFVSGSFPEERGETAFFGLNKKHSHRVGQVKDIAKIHTNPECPCAMLDRQSGNRSFGNKQGGYSYKGKQYQVEGFIKNNSPQALSNYGDTGGASRFFYCAKASRSERGKDNKHPTVKPIKLIKYLIKLTSMPNKNQIYLDPFAGSGTTGVACKELGRNFIGIEIEPKYFEIAQRRINQATENLL